MSRPEPEPGRAHVSDGEAVRFAPASFAQRQFWLLDRLTGGHPVYNAPRRYHLTGPLDVPALERAECDVAPRHPDACAKYGTAFCSQYRHYRG